MSRAPSKVPDAQLVGSNPVLVLARFSWSSHLRVVVRFRYSVTELLARKSFCGQFQCNARRDSKRVTERWW